MKTFKEEMIEEAIEILQKDVECKDILCKPCMKSAEDIWGKVESLLQENAYFRHQLSEKISEVQNYINKGDYAVAVYLCDGAKEFLNKWQ